MNTTFVLPLSELAWLRIDGADARDFLQGQLSSDLRQLTPQRAQISSYNSAKGRMLAAPHLLAADDQAVLIELPRVLAEPVLKRLRMFVLRSRVRCADAGDTVAGLGLIGSGAAALLREAELPVPAQALDCAHSADGAIVLRRIGAPERYSVLAAPAQVAALAARWQATAAFEAWRLADIEAGVPVIYPQTSDRFVPQMANLDRLGGIGFDKGCYTGQEIVARLHYLGQLKRRMLRLGFAGAAVAPGSEIFTAAEPAAVVGEIVDAVARDGRCMASAVVQLAQLDQPWRLADGRPVQRLASPPDGPADAAPPGSPDPAAA